VHGLEEAALVYVREVDGVKIRTLSAGIQQLLNGYIISKRPKYRVAAAKYNSFFERLQRTPDGFKELPTNVTIEAFEDMTRKK